MTPMPTPPSTDPHRKDAMNTALVIYHAACRDGFAAAWCVWRRFPKSEFVAAYHGTEPPNVRGRDVVIVDFSYPREVMERIASECATLLVLDHHKTAEAALRDFRAANARVVFDMERSGAGLAWDEYFPNSPRPWLVDYVEDRDLWRHKLSDGPAVNAYISTLRFDFEDWYRATREDLAHIAKLGEVVENKIRQYVLEVSKNARRVSFDGHTIPLVNVPQVDVSEVGSYLAQGEPFAMAWWQRGDGQFVYSLRSREPSTVDVSDIARKHGGGGHARAAGFQTLRPLFMEASR